MSKTARWVLTAIVLGLMAFMVYNSMARVRKHCDVCVVFNGRRNCARVAGGNEGEALQGAQTTACGTLASGMDESIRCQKTPPQSASCSTN
ncbi:MAG: hypothetical protein ACHQU1_02130 [Gemmatimonadales bacterium]